MQELLPQAYLIGLIVLLGAAAVLVGRQILRVRKDEQALSRLSSPGPGGALPADSVGLYELASVQLRKRLYGHRAHRPRAPVADAGFFCAGSAGPG